MMLATLSLTHVQQKIDEVKQFLAIAMRIANAHTVEFYTHDVWSRFMAVAPEEVLSAVSADQVHQREHSCKENGEQSTFGFCPESHHLVKISEMLEAARMHSLPGLGICFSREELLLSVQKNCSNSGSSTKTAAGATLETDEFMNSKKSHEVQCMSEVVAQLAQQCQVTQIIDVGSGKGYLSSFLSMQYGLQVYGIDSSSTNTHGARERDRKLKKFSKAFQQHSKAKKRNTLEGEIKSNIITQTDQRKEVEKTELPLSSVEDLPNVIEEHMEPNMTNQESSEDLFLNALSLDVIETTSSKVPSCQLTEEEREKRKKKNLERKAQNTSRNEGPLFSPITSYVTAETELRELISELQAAVLVGLHTCGDLAPSSLRMFVAKAELSAVCSVGCCYHLLSEEFDPTAEEGSHAVNGFPLSQYLRDQSWFCGRNARMSACLALERFSHGQGIPLESLFYRAVLHVILRDHYGSFKSEKRVGNVYSKTKSFVEYVRRALQRLELDETKLPDNEIQGYHDKYSLRMNELQAFTMLKVALAPCIEGLILLDRLCYLKEQENVSFSALVQLFDPLLSPRCYAVIGLKKNR
ncbi:methyltransferase-like protein 25 isoform X2 [Boleophthalmus pectinirostris]|uniref:methyltransferase-like protein 25 isoform X2 n=1 Tax=Boleophthalmus pectinirostris TaxID=150288 RepID=UPI00242E82CE|nr:methyltransferase-like protein 25 isoform X2 [Boleophthalmus pectinirostris]